MKKIIIKKPDSGIIITRPNLDKYSLNGGEPIIKGKKRVAHVEDVEREVEVEKIDRETGSSYKIKEMATEQIITHEEVDNIVGYKKPFSECKALKSYDPETKVYSDAGHDWFPHDGVVDESGIESSAQLYHDGTNEIKKDLNWEIKLMPDYIIKNKHLERIRADLDTELEKINPDAVKVVKMQRDLDKHKEIKAGGHNEDPVWINVAIANLDKRVAKGEADKPGIRQKLIDKKAELILNGKIKVTL